MSRTLKIELPCRRELNFHVFPVSAFNIIFCLNLERLGRLLGSTWSFLGASWAPFGPNLGALGTNLAPTWAPLGPTWRQLGRLGGQVGTNLNPHWAIMGDLVTLLERSWSLLGASGPFKGDLGLILMPQEGFWRLRDTISTPTSLYFGLSGDRFWCVTSAATAHRKRIRQQC